jgi:hypothetical protein
MVTNNDVKDAQWIATFVQCIINLVSNRDAFLQLINNRIIFLVILFCLKFTAQ